MDMLPAKGREQRTREIVKRLTWRAPVYAISAINGTGCRELMQAIMEHIEKQLPEAGSE